MIFFSMKRKIYDKRPFKGNGMLNENHLPQVFNQRSWNLSPTHTHTHRRLNWNESYLVCVHFAMYLKGQRNRSLNDQRESNRETEQILENIKIFFVVNVVYWNGTRSARNVFIFVGSERDATYFPHSFWRFCRWWLPYKFSVSLGKCPLRDIFSLRCFEYFYFSLSLPHPRFLSLFVHSVSNIWRIHY